MGHEQEGWRNCILSRTEAETLAKKRKALQNLGNSITSWVVAVMKPAFEGIIYQEEVVNSFQSGG